MALRHQLVCTGVSCALALSSAALAAGDKWDVSDSTSGGGAGKIEDNKAPAPVGDGDLHAPAAGYDDITRRAVPEPSMAALIGAIGLLALVRRRRG